MNSDEKNIVDTFHDLYHLGTKSNGSIYQQTKWMGTPCFKCPLDLWIYHEILLEVKPDIVIETGTYKGGSALYIAHILDILQNGQVISVDIEEHERPSHERINYITGSSIDKALVTGIFESIPDSDTILVILDSNHSEEHVAKELELFSPYVSVGSYLIVEDTNLNGHPTYANHGPGPYEAVEKFLKRYDNYSVDQSRELFLLTFNPGGYLKKIKK